MLQIGKNYVVDSAASAYVGKLVDYRDESNVVLYLENALRIGRDFLLQSAVDDGEFLSCEGFDPVELILIPGITTIFIPYAAYPFDHKLPEPFLPPKEEY